MTIRKLLLEKSFVIDNKMYKIPSNKLNKKCAGSMGRKAQNLASLEAKEDVDKWKDTCS